MNPFKQIENIDQNDADIAHPFKVGSCVQACSIHIVRRPIFFRALVTKPVFQIADFYEGVCEGEKQVKRFFAHPTWQDAQSEAALLLHFRASLAPESFYAFDASLLPVQGRRG